MEYIATFHTHYGAIKYHNKLNTDGIPSSMMPIPRVLSSSCGTCVRFTSPSTPSIDGNKEDIECLYAIEAESNYKLLYDNR